MLLGASTAWISNCNRPRIVVGHGPKHVDELIFVLRLHVNEIRDMPQITNIEETMMGGTVVTT